MSRHAFRRPGLTELRVHVRPDRVCVSIAYAAHKAGNSIVFATARIADVVLAPDDRATPTGLWNLCLAGDTIFALTVDEAIAIAASGVITPTHALPAEVAA